MKKTAKILITALFAVSFGSLAMAQSASISANATVISEIAVTSGTNLNFGTVVVGQTKTIDARNNVSVSAGPNLGNASRASFTVAAQAGSPVGFRFTYPEVLVDNNNNTLPISFVVADGTLMEGGPTLPEFTNSFGLSKGFNLDPFPEFQAVPDTNSINIYFGGEVNATSATAGTYSGTITLTATFN